jgi:uncharacterized protein YhhL (DUF1145 family)
VQLAKIATLAMWVACLATFFTSGNSWPELAGRTCFWVLLLAHLVEFLFYYRPLKRLGEPMTRHFFSVLLFGVAHWWEQKPRIPAA